MTLREHAAAAFVFLLGLFIGSFLGAASYRIPRGISIVWPPSACPACRARLGAADLIPVASYWLLRGRCRHCGAPISKRYVVIELLTGVLFAGVYAAATRGFGAAPDWAGFGAGASLASLLLLMAVIDLEHMRLPDTVNATGAVIGFGLALLGAGVVTPAHALYGAALGFLVVVVIILASRGGMGLGDAKFLAMIGTFVGPAGVLYTLLGASFLGALVGLALIRIGRLGAKTPIPFGPFLAAAALAVWVYFYATSH